jgi:hypothetical protein
MTQPHEFQRACDDTGWPCSIDASGATRVQLATRSGEFIAVPEWPWRSEIAVELADLSTASPISHRAIDALLQELAAAVAGLSAMCTEHQGRFVARISAAIEAPGDAEIDRVLSALATACEMAGREVAALADEQLATAYLDLNRTEPESLIPEEEHACLQPL